MCQACTDLEMCSRPQASVRLKLGSAAVSPGAWKGGGILVGLPTMIMAAVPQTDAVTTKRLSHQIAFPLQKVAKIYAMLFRTNGRPGLTTERKMCPN